MLAAVFPRASVPVTPSTGDDPVSSFFKSDSKPAATPAAAEPAPARSVDRVAEQPSVLGRGMQITGNGGYDLASRKLHGHVEGRDLILSKFETIKEDVRMVYMEELYQSILAEQRRTAKIEMAR